MSKFKNMYKDFFGLNEQNDSKMPNPEEIEKTTDAVKELEVATEKLGDAMKDAGLTEEELDEAQLINNMTDYRGGVQYMLYDPAMAQNVATEIRNFATKKKIYVIDYKQSKDGRFGYFLFRIGDDPAKESQQIQGYISSKPEIKHFRFKILEDRSRKKRINKNQ
jgi:hypothetical protein